MRDRGVPRTFRPGGPPPHGRPGSGGPGDDPIELAPGVWWVGRRLPDDRFQCHSYYLRQGDQGVLIDPGSPLTIETTLAKVARIDPLDAIRFLVCHHSDPDIAACLPYLSGRLQRPDVQVVTEWRARALLRHYGHRFSYYLVEQHGWRLPLGPDRALEFQLTPYLHFPGALVSYDTSTSILFSSDLFGGFVPDASTLIGDDVDTIIRGATPFHQHYMPSTELLAAGLTRIQHRWPRIAMIAPQHGHVVPSALVAPVFEQLKQLECGVFALADADIDLTRLLRIAEARTSLINLVLAHSDPSQLLLSLRTQLQRIQEVVDCTLAIELSGQGWIRWSGSTPEPTPAPPPEGWVRVPLGEDPPAVLSLQLREDHPPTPICCGCCGALPPPCVPGSRRWWRSAPMPCGCGCCSSRWAPIPSRVCATGVASRRMTSCPTTPCSPWTSTTSSW